MNYDVILIRYGELSLKSPYVRKTFESTLIRNIKNTCKSNHITCNIVKERGRIYLYTPKISRGLNVLKKIFGITSLSRAIETTAEIQNIADYALKISKKFLNKKTKFALRVTRTGTHDYTSQDIAVKLGNIIRKATKAQVNLTNPAFELFIEIRNNKTFLYTEKIPGPGGLPLGTQGKTVTIIDSPQSLLAAWYLMRRGCAPVFIASSQKNQALTHSFLSRWNLDASISLEEVHEEDFYKALNRTAEENRCLAVVTGHSLYQDKPVDVATITSFKENIQYPVFHPLIAMTEKEIREKSKEIGIPL
jgi:thiamine biosynthesis protein ThiI